MKTKVLIKMEITSSYIRYFNCSSKIVDVIQILNPILYIKYKKSQLNDKTP